MQREVAWLQLLLCCVWQAIRGCPVEFLINQLIKHLLVLRWQVAAILESIWTASHDDMLSVIAFAHVRIFSSACAHHPDASRYDSNE